MDEKDIPQHGSKIFAGQKKVLYAKIGRASCRERVSSPV